MRERATSAAFRDEGTAGPPGHPQLLQRKCACGGSPGMDGERSQCRAKRLGPQLSVSGGQPVGGPIGRTSDQPGFGHHFGEVQVHSLTRSLTTGDDDSGNVTNTAAVRASRAQFITSPSASLKPFMGPLNGKDFFGVPFSISAQLPLSITSGACEDGSCFEYRQFVRGTMTAQGQSLGHRLCSRPLSPGTFQEDCATLQGKDFKYGYHSIPFANSNFSNPDQGTGCQFDSFDYPGINVGLAKEMGVLNSGDPVALHLEFQGKLVDSCAQDFTVQTAGWAVDGQATVP